MSHTSRASSSKPQGVTTAAIYGAKGGVGTSTIAALLALSCAPLGRTLLVDTSITNDLEAVLGVPGSVDRSLTTVIADSLYLANLETQAPPVWDVEIIDAGTGTTNTQRDAIESSAITVLVVRNDYLSLRRATLSPYKPTHLVLREASRALDARGCGSLHGLPAIVVEVDPALARTIDAGLLVNRSHHGPPRHATRALSHLTSHLMEVYA
jgi:hypothetical protein